MTDQRDAEIARLREELEKLRSDESYDTYRVRSLRERSEKAEAALAESEAAAEGALMILAQTQAERDKAQTDLGRIIMSLPTGKGERAAGAVEGVKMMRARLEAERDAALALLDRRDAPMRVDGLDALLMDLHDLASDAYDNGKEHESNTMIRAYDALAALRSAQPVIGYRAEATINPSKGKDQ